MKKILLFVAAAMVAMSASAANYLAGTLPGLTWASDGYPIEGTAVFEDVPAGTYEFKVTNGTWTDALGTNAVDASQSTPGYNTSADNVTFTIKSTATITITTDGASIILKSTVPFGSVEITSYTIVGAKTLLGVEWDTNAEENNLTQEGSVWTLVKEGVELEAGSYGYKVVGNHSYSIYQYPQQGDNSLEIEETGIYNVTFTLDFSADTPLSAVATPATATDLEDVDAEDAIIAAYDITGKPVAADAAGIVILQYASGKAVKVFNN